MNWKLTSKIIKGLGIISGISGSLISASSTKIVNSPNSMALITNGIWNRIDLTQIDQTLFMQGLYLICFAFILEGITLFLPERSR